MSGRALAVVSGKGGVGKTMIVAALGAHWARAGKRVVLIDMSIGMRGLDMALNLHSRVGFDLGDVLDGRVGLDRAMIEDKETGVRLIAAKQFTPEAPLNERALQLIIEVLCMQNDRVLLDAPAGIGENLDLATRMAQETLLVSTPDDAALRTTDRVRAILNDQGRTDLQLVVSRIREDLVDAKLQYAPEVCSQLLDLPLAGVVPEDDAALRSTLAMQPLDPASRASRAIANLAARIDGEPMPLWAWRDRQRIGGGIVSQEKLPARRRGLLSRLLGND